MIVCSTCTGQRTASVTVSQLPSTIFVAWSLIALELLQGDNRVFPASASLLMELYEFNILHGFWDSYLRFSFLGTM